MIVEKKNRNQRFFACFVGIVATAILLGYTQFERTEIKVFKIERVDPYTKGIYQNDLSSPFFESGYLEKTFYTDGPTFALFSFSGSKGETTVHVGRFIPTSESKIREAKHPLAMLALKTLPSNRVPLRDYKKIEDAKSRNEMQLRVTYHKKGWWLAAISLEATLSKDWIRDAWNNYASKL